MSIKKIFINHSEELKKYFDKPPRDFVVYYGNIKVFSNHIYSVYTEIKDIFEKSIYNIELDSCYPVIIDGGAHIGISILFYKLKFPEAKILAFEPDPLAFSYLKKNMRANRIKNITLINKALHEKKSTFFFLSDGSDGGRISENGNYTIEAETLSKYINKPVDIIKLNIEGMEKKVIEEIEPKLNFVKNIIFEYHNFPELEDNELSDILKILSKNGFRYVINNFDKEINPISYPPYNLGKNSRYFQLVYAKNLRYNKEKGLSKKETLNIYNKASEYEREFDFKKAKNEFCKILDKSSNLDNKLKAGIYFHLGCIERKLGNEDIAVEYFRKTLKLIPEHKKAKLYLEKPILKGLSPISGVYGADRGNSIDRYYIGKFLKENSSFIKGNVLEILDNRYTLLFGKDKVKKSEILDIDRKNKGATIYADLRKPKELPEAQFDCIILTQTIHVIDDMFSVIESVYKMLKKGGVVLATLPCLSRIDVAAGIEGDFWRFTKASAKYLFETKFKSKNLEIKVFGNVFSSSAFLYGYSNEELTKEELDYTDPNFPMLIGVKAKK